MSGIVDDIRAAVTAAAAAVDDLLIGVTHESYTTSNSDGLPSYSTGVVRPAYLTTGTKALFRQTGVESVLGPTLLFLSNVSFDVKDRLTMPDGTHPPIVEINGINDPDGGTFYTQVKCGRPERGAVT